MVLIPAQVLHLSHGSYFPHLTTSDKLLIFINFTLMTYLRSLFVFFVLLVGNLSPIFAQNNCSTASCTTNSLSLNTGIDPVSGLSYPLATNGSKIAVAQDPYWRLVAGPNANPGPTWVLNPYSNWNPAANANWVSRFNQADHDNVGPGLFTYERCFCLCQPTTINLNFRVFADDEVKAIRLGGQTLAFSPAYPQVGSNLHFTTGVTPNLTTTTLAAGQHCLQIDMEDTDFWATGLKVEGDLTGGIFENSTCAGSCAPGGSISGFKFDDEDANGVWDTGEPVLPTWRINLSDGQSVLTDQNGFYSFYGLAPGSYTVTESQQFGWNQTFPSGNQGHSLTLNGNQALIRNFGNSKVPAISSISGKKFHDLNCDGERQENEPYLAGWVFDLLSGDEQNVIQTVLTDRNGCFEFSDLEVGYYTVQERMQDGWQQSFPGGLGTHSIDILIPASYEIEFGNCLVDNPDTCCDAEDEAPIFYEGFEQGVNYTNTYNLGTAQAPGEYAYMDGAQANNISGGNWDVHGYSFIPPHCDPIRKFMVVDGRTNQTGEAQIYRSDYLNTENEKTYSVCVRFKHLPALDMDIVPIVRLEVAAIVGFQAPIPIFTSANTTISTDNDQCDYITISGTFTGVSKSSYTGCFIRIFLDETGNGLGNDLVVDEIRVSEVYDVSRSIRDFNVFKTSVIAGQSYNLTAESVIPLPENCTNRWEVYEIENGCYKLTPIAETYMTGNEHTTPAWGNPTNFPGYNATSPTPGLFLTDKDYVIRRIVDCDCRMESEAIWSSSINFGTPDQQEERIPQIGSNSNKKTESNMPANVYDSGFSISPNPFHSTFTIRFSEVPKTVGTIEIFNSSGQLVKRLKYAAEEQIIQIDFSELPRGSYFAKATIGAKINQQIIIKQ